MTAMRMASGAYARAAAVLAACAAVLAGATASPAGAARGAAPNADLALMVVPLQRLLEVDPAKATVSGEAGPIDAVEQAYKTIDPLDTPNDIRKRGFVAGFDLGYAWSEGKLLSVGTTVLRFRDAATAAAYVATQERDNARFARKPIPPLGVIVTGGELWVPKGLAGLPARGSQGTLELGGKRWKAGGVTFRYGGLVATVTAARSDDGDLRALVEANAKLLRERIDAVAGGSRLDGPPALKTRLGFGSSAKPAGAPGLDKLAVSVDDLPGGGVVRSSGWISTPGITGFDRTMRVNVRPIGGSYLTDLDVTLLAHDDVPGARGTYDAMTNIAFFTSLINRTARIASTRGLKLSAEGDAPADVGEQGRVLTWRLDTPIGPARVVAVVTRVGTNVEALIATGSAVMLHAEDIVALLRSAVGRLGNPGAGR